jgi:hypothetical protein
MQKTWVDNAFYTDGTTDRKDTITAIVELREDENSPVTRQVVTIQKENPDGSENPDWKEVTSAVPLQTIEENTQHRAARKTQERQQQAQHQAEVARAKALEDLFNYKLRAFEIEDIKNSTNRVLKAKLRKSKNTVEVNVYATMIIMENMNSESTEEESK